MPSDENTPMSRMLGSGLTASDRNPSMVVPAVITIGGPVRRSVSRTTSRGVPPCAATSAYSATRCNEYTVPSTSSSGGKAMLPRLRLRPASTIAPSVQTRLRPTVSPHSTTPRHDRKQANSTIITAANVSGRNSRRSPASACAAYTLKRGSPV